MPSAAEGPVEPRAGVGTTRADALDAFRRGEGDAVSLLERALEASPHDGDLLIAHASAGMLSGKPDASARIEAILRQAPDWVDGHKALVRLKTEAGLPQPFASLEAALEKLPRHPGLWMAYLTLLGSAGRHGEAADHAANLRCTIADMPELRLVEARFSGFSGQIERAGGLLEGLPEHLPELHFERARQALRRGDTGAANSAIDRGLDQNPADIGMWALAELCWRASGDNRHDWLLQGENLFARVPLGIEHPALDQICDAVGAAHTASAAPLGQSVKGGTQTRGDLRDRADPHIAELFSAIEEALSRFGKRFGELPDKHPLSPLMQRCPRIAASWSIRLTGGGHHVSHLHDGGLLSSAAHLRVPDSVAAGEGVLELGRPPKDIPLGLEPLAVFDPLPGYLVLFPSFLYHGTTPFSVGERLTVAFDAV